MVVSIQIVPIYLIQNFARIERFVQNLTEIFSVTIFVNSITRNQYDYLRG